MYVRSLTLSLVPTLSANPFGSALKYITSYHPCRQTLVHAITISHLHYRSSFLIAFPALVSEDLIIVNRAGEEGPLFRPVFSLKAI